MRLSSVFLYDIYTLYSLLIDDTLIFNMKITVKDKRKRMCPRCNIPLDVVTWKWLELDLCPRCHGSWFDQWEIKAYLGLSKKDLLDYIPFEERKRVDSGLPCPSCGKSLWTLKANSVFPFDIDMCHTEKGYWFDGGELELTGQMTEKTKLRLKAVDHSLEEKRQEEFLQRQTAIIESRYRGHHSPDAAAPMLGNVSFFGDLSPLQKLIALVGLPVENDSFYDLRSWMNLLLVFVNILVFTFMVILSGTSIAGIFGDLPKEWYMKYGFIPDNFTASPISMSFTLFSSMFMHAGIIHLLGNMFFLFTTGDDIEKRIGHFPFLIFYLSAGVVADLVSLFFGHSPNIPHVGASGAIAGVMGAYMVLCRHKSFYVWIIRVGVFGKMISVSAGVYLFFWFCFQLLSAKFGGYGVDYMAHIGGFIFGITVGIIINITQSYNAFSGKWEWLFRKDDKETFLNRVR